MYAQSVLVNSLVGLVNSLVGSQNARNKYKLKDHPIHPYFADEKTRGPEPQSDLLKTHHFGEANVLRKMLRYLSSPVWGYIQSPV